MNKPLSKTQGRNESGVCTIRVGSRTSASGEGRGLAAVAVGAWAIHLFGRDGASLDEQDGEVARGRDGP
jgi:hypothetical protein